MDGGLTVGGWESKKRASTDLAAAESDEARGARKPFISPRPHVARRGPGRGRGARDQGKPEALAPGLRSPRSCRRHEGIDPEPGSGVRSSARGPRVASKVRRAGAGRGRLSSLGCCHHTRPQLRSNSACKSGDFLPPARAAFASCRGKGIGVRSMKGERVGQ